MARQFCCPRCLKLHRGASHSKGSLSVVCTSCVPIAVVATLAGALIGDNGKPTRRRSRKKVSK